MQAMALRTTTAEPVPLGEYVPEADSRLVLRDVGWRGFRTLLAMRGERGSPRMTYLDGSVELMTPSRHHERYKAFIGRLLEAYLTEAGISFVPYGAWLLDDESDEAGKEPDECYILGKDQSEEIDRPHLAIEVVWTSGGLNSLEVYRRLGVREVWFWKRDDITVHVLAGEHYELRERSDQLPDLDLELICRLAHRATVDEAVAELKRELAATR